MYHYISQKSLHLGVYCHTNTYVCICTHTHTAFTTLSQSHFRPTGLDPRTVEEEDRENARPEGHAGISMPQRVPLVQVVHLIYLKVTCTCLLTLIVYRN